MLTKKLILAGVAGATLAATAPAFADEGWYGRGHGYWGGPEKRVVVEQRYTYAPPPRRVVVVERPAVVYRPAPAYYAQPYYAQPSFGASVSGDAAVGVLLGAAVGAFIGHEIATGN